MGSKIKLVRMAWEKPYIEALIDVLKPSGAVLEVGFDQGFAAERIQTFKPASHTIIEHRPEAIEKAMKWSKDKPHVRLIQDSWEKAIPKLGVFEAIFFNDFDPEITAEIHEHREAGLQLLKKEKELASFVEEKIPQLTSIKYSDRDIDEFYKEIGQFQKNDMAAFLFTLKSNGQITEAQYEAMIKKYQLEKKEKKTAPLAIEKKADPTFIFFEACAKNHMKKGSRFSSFSMSPVSKFENPHFFDHIITNPNFDYREETIPVKVTKDCPYYKYQNALVMVIEKLA